jgi:hypothetical protein
MNRQELINRLVTRKLQSTGTNQPGGIPCWGAAGRVQPFGPAGSTKAANPQK